MQNFIRLILRTEGAVIAGAASLFYAQTGASWWLFAALILAPDLAMLGYAAGSRIGAFSYNLAHTLVFPLGVAVIAAFTAPALMPIALIWIVHIGGDRAIGYGLKYASGFRQTHLQRI